MKRPVSQLSILPWLVFAGFMALTVLATRYVHQMTRAADRARFENALQSTRDALEARLDAYMNVLIATRGVVVVDPTLPRRAVHDYIASLDLQNRYPGVQGLGLTMRFPAKELERVEEEMRSSGIDDFRIWPKDPPRDEYHAIVVIEPLDARNRAALGYDMFTHDGRRQAMIRARDTGAPAASGMVTLVQEIEKQKQPGFLIYAPLYATGTPPPTVALRRAALVGYVYAPFRAYDLLTGIFGRQERPEVGFEIRDQGDLLYRTAELPAEPRFTELTTMNVAGRTWTIRWESRRQGGGPALRLAVATFTGGVIISILLLMLLRVQLSARQQAEETAERLLQSEAALQRANAAKDDFLATLSHELRTPMTAIMGWAEILRGGSMDPESQQYALQAIHQSSRAQAQLIEDLLDVSRIAAGKLRLEKKRIDLKGVVEDAVATVRGAADARGIRIESDLAPEVFVHGDPQRLTQVVWNLVSNAVKFSPDDSSVEVSLRQAHQEAVIEVRDRGTGIDPAFMPHLFERFRQADSSSTRPHTGLGLGLAIVQHIVGLHEGSVEAESPGVGEGATFRVRLPLAQTRW